MLPSLCVAFLTGLVIGSFLPFFPIVLLFVLLVFIVILSALERAGVIDLPKSVMWCAALCLGVVYWTGVTPPISDPARDDLLFGSSLEYTGRVIGLVQHGPSRLTMLVEIGSSSQEATFTGRIKLTWRDPGDAVWAGDLITFRVRLRVPTGSLSPTGFDHASYVERQGIEAVGTVTGPEGIHPPSVGNRAEVVVAKLGAHRSMARDHSRESDPIARPACPLSISGDRVRRAEVCPGGFERMTGTIHLLSISGSHSGLIAVVVFGSIRRALTFLPALMLLGMSRLVTPTRVAILCTWLMVTFYALLAGAAVQPSSGLRWRAWRSRATGLIRVRWFHSVIRC